MWAVAIAVSILALGCPQERSPQPPRPLPKPATGRPSTDRIDLPPIEITLPSQGSHVFVIATPPYDGPSLGASSAVPLAKDRAIAATLSKLARDRLAAVVEMRKASELAQRDRAAVDRKAADAEARLTKIRETQQQRVAKAEARRVRAVGKLRPLLDKHAATRGGAERSGAILTIEGAVLRVVLALDVAHDEHAKRLDEIEARGDVSLDELDDARLPDVTIPRTLVDELFDRYSTASKHADARYIRAHVYDFADRSTGAVLLLQVARDFPTSPVAEPSYHVAGHSLYGDPGDLARSGAREAFTWLAEKATGDTARSMARFRLAVLLDREREFGKAVEQACKIVDDPKLDTTIAEETMYYLSRSVIRGGLSTLRAACDAQQCPCKEPVVSDVITHLRAVDEPGQLAEVVAMARARFPTMTIAPEAAVSPRGDGSDADHIKADVEASGAIAFCLQLARDHRLKELPRELRVVLSIDKAGATRSASVASTDPETNECVKAWFQRHRWRELGPIDVAIPIVVK